MTVETDIILANAAMQAHRYTLSQVEAASALIAERVALTAGETGAAVIKAASKAGTDHKITLELLQAAGTQLSVLAMQTAPTPPPPPPPPPVDPGDPTQPPVFPSESGFGCPTDIDLIDWPYDPNEGAGRPAGVATPDPGVGKNPPADVPTIFAHCDFHPGLKPYTGQNGLHDGIPGTMKGLVFRRGQSRDCEPWHFNGEVTDLNLEDWSFLGGTHEHHVYFKLNGGGKITLRRLLSKKAPSQVLQVVKRQDEVHSFTGGPMLYVADWFAIDHANENGNGTRMSHGFKVFGAQDGSKSGGYHGVTFEHEVLMERLWLNDSMQQNSMGAMLIGDTLFYAVLGLVASGGQALQEAVHIQEGEHPVYIDGLHLWYKSAEAGRGVKIDDPDRPVKILPGKGNLRFVGPDGQKVSHVRDGYEQHWKPEYDAKLASMKAEAATR